MRASTGRTTTIIVPIYTTAPIVVYSPSSGDSDCAKADASASTHHAATSSTAAHDSACGERIQHKAPKAFGVRCVAIAGSNYTVKADVLTCRPMGVCSRSMDLSSDASTGKAVKDMAVPADIDKWRRQSVSQLLATMQGMGQSGPCGSSCSALTHPQTA